jgi:hypothetical protein
MKYVSVVFRVAFGGAFSLTAAFAVALAFRTPTHAAGRPAALVLAVLAAYVATRSACGEVLLRENTLIVKGCLRTRKHPFAAIRQVEVKREGLANLAFLRLYFDGTSRTLVESAAGSTAARRRLEEFASAVSSRTEVGERE